MFVIFFSLNGWLAAICLACIVLSIGLQYINFMGKTAKTFTANYFDTQERMSGCTIRTRYTRRENIRTERKILPTIPRRNSRI